MFKWNLVYEDYPRYDWWLKALLGGILILTLIMGFIFLKIDAEASAVMFGVTAFDGLLFYFIFPRIYSIYSDRLVIRLGGPFSVKILLSDIIAIRPISAGRSVSYSGFKMATSHPPTGKRFWINLTRL